MLVLEGGWCRSQDIVGQMDFGLGGGNEHPEGKVDIAGDKAVEMDCGLVWRSRWKQYWSAFGHGKGFADVVRRFRHGCAARLAPRL